MQEEVEAAAQEARAFADESPEPQLEPLADIYAKPFPDSMSPSNGLS